LISELKRIGEQKNDNLLFHSYIYNMTVYYSGRNKCKVARTYSQFFLPFLQQTLQQQ